MIHFGKPLGYTIDNLQKIANFKIFNIYCNLKLLSKKCAKTKKCAKHDKLYIFKKPLPWRTQICENIFEKQNFYSRKTENLQILFKWICAKNNVKFLRKNCAIYFLLFKAFQRAIKSQNLMTGRKSKYRFSRVKVK